MNTWKQPAGPPPRTLSAVLLMWSHGESHDQMVLWSNGHFSSRPRARGAAPGESNRKAGQAAGNIPRRAMSVIPGKAAGSHAGEKERRGVRCRGAAPPDCLVLTLAFPVFWSVWVALAGGYDGRIIGLGSEEFRRVLNA